jgi:hypothetical protein
VELEGTYAANELIRVMVTGLASDCALAAHPVA